MFSFLLLAFLGTQPVAASDFDRPRSVTSGNVEPASGPLTVVTWNIDRGTELSKEIEGLKEHPAGLILLQEVDSNTDRSGDKDETAELARALGMDGVFGIEFQELSQGKDHPAYIGQATLTHLPVRQSRVLRFAHQSNFWKPRSWLPNIPLMQRREGSRIALVTELTYAGKPLVVYNAHLESRSYGHIQIQQLDEILTDLKHYPAGTAVILAGDLNSKYFPSIYLHKLQREGFASATGKRTPITHNIPSALDWIFARGVTIGGGKVQHQLKGSDHYAVYAVIGAK